MLLSSQADGPGEGRHVQRVQSMCKQGHAFAAGSATVDAMLRITARSVPLLSKPKRVAVGASSLHAHMIYLSLMG